MAGSLKQFLKPVPPAAAEPDGKSPSLVTGADLFAVDFVRVNGNRLAIPYGYIQSVEWDRSGDLVVSTASHRVLVRGRNLEAVYVGLVTRTAATLAAVSDRPRVAGDVAVITEVQVNDSKKSRPVDDA